jgi:hypothetical protein
MRAARIEGGRDAELRRLRDLKSKEVYKAEETDVPAAAKTVAISASAKDKKHCTTTGSNCVPLH